MRHNVYGWKLNRDVKERNALFKSLVLSLVISGKIKTTMPKAKAVRGLVEKLVTKAKSGSDHSKRMVAEFLSKREAIRKFNDSVVPRFTETKGGYIRIRRIGVRKGDSAEEVLMEWSKEEVKPQKIAKPAKNVQEEKTEKPVKQKTRSRRPVKKANK